MATKPDTTSDEYERRYMQPGESVLFREKVVSQTAFRLSVAFMLIFGLVGIAALVAGAAGATPLAPALGLGIPFALFGAMMGVLGVMFSVFRVMVTGAHVHVHFGWSKRKIPLSAIDSIRAITLQGFKQGKVSVGLDGVVRTWVGNSRSGQGVEITYRDGERKHVLTIGSEEAERFVATVERGRVASGAGSNVRVATDEGASSTAAQEVDGELEEENAAKNAMRAD